MRKSGQARVLSQQQQQLLFNEIKQHRHPEKNTAIMQISFKLGLRAQEIALLQLKEIARLGQPRKNTPRDFELLEILSLPAAYTKGANAIGRSQNKEPKNRSMTFTQDEFDRIIRNVESLAKAGAEVDPKEYYPPVRRHKGKSRDLPMVEPDLRNSLTEYLSIRLERDHSAKPSDPLFLTQKGGPYSPNTLQEHMALMLRSWAGVEKASSHSGRRSLITNIIHKQKKSVKVAQKIAGHVNPSTTIIYEEPPEDVIEDALTNLK